MKSEVCAGGIRRLASETAKEAADEIVGAGPAGLAAALTVARSGGKAIVYERGADVGQRFHGDFQGIENWTTKGDVLEELASMGVEPTFEHTAFREVTFYDARGRRYLVRAGQPLFYLVRRGTGPGTLDRALKEQALGAGVEFRFRTTRDRLPAQAIVAQGPGRADAISTGFVFETDLPDGAFTVASDFLAPKGYAYLLICGGRGTVAACIFRDFSNQKLYVDRTVDFFRQKVGLGMRNPRRFGGFCSLFPAGGARPGEILFVGEAAGFQDALFGFGMRYAMISGHLAARARVQGRPEIYDLLWRQRFGHLLQLSVVNRYFYETFGDPGYARLLRQVSGASDSRDWLRKYYGAGRLKRLLYPLARHLLARKVCRNG